MIRTPKQIAQTLPLERKKPLQSSDAAQSQPSEYNQLNEPARQVSDTASRQTEFKAGIP